MRQIFILEHVYLLQVVNSVSKHPRFFSSAAPGVKPLTYLTDDENVMKETGMIYYISEGSSCGKLNIKKKDNEFCVRLFHKPIK